jgi:predicted transcriptional regulator
LHKGRIVSFAAQLGLTHEATYPALNELVNSERVIKKERGNYQLKK